MNKNEIEMIYNELNRTGSASYSLNDVPISMTLTIKNKTISFSGRVYQGEGFIPEKIREAAGESYFNEDEIKTHIFIEEDAAAIYLCYNIPSGKDSFKRNLEHFLEKTLFWLELFSEKDQDELVPVRKTRNLLRNTGSSTCPRL